MISLASTLENAPDSDRWEVEAFASPTRNEGFGGRLSLPNSGAAAVMTTTSRTPGTGGRELLISLGFRSFETGRFEDPPPLVAEHEIRESAGLVARL